MRHDESGSGLSRERIVYMSVAKVLNKVALYARTLE
jgi:hypothetical protein